MKINEASEKTGLSCDTIRYYEKIGLVNPLKKDYSRDYSLVDIERLEIIVKLKNTGLTLDEIKSLVDLDNKIESPSKITDKDREILTFTLDLFKNKKEVLEERLKDIKFSLSLVEKITKKIENALEKGVN